MKLSLAMIAKNEQENLDACLSSVKAYVDEIVVVDTGSSDRTPEVAEKHGARVALFTPETHPESFFMDDEKTCQTFSAPGAYSGEVMLGDFGAARRFSFSKVSGDLILWLDADDVLEGAEHLPKIAALMHAQNMDMGFLAYDYARDHLGRTYYRQWRERILRRDCATWVNPVHEVLLPQRPVTSSRFEGVTVVHRRKADRKTTPHRNYKILLRQLHQEKQNGTSHDPRTLFYLGQEARWTEPHRAVDFYEQYLRLSGWAEERAAAHMAQGSICEFGQLPNITSDDAYARADREYATAAVEMPGNPDGLFGAARIAYLRGRWQDCVDYSNRAFAIGNTESMLGANPMDRLYRPHVYYNHALSKLGRIEEAIASCKAGLDVCPDDPGVPGGAPGMLKFNLECYERELASRVAIPAPAKEGTMVQFDKNEDVDAPAQNGIPTDALVIWAMQLWKQARGDEKRERAILDGLPPHIAIDPVVARMRISTERRFPSVQSHIPKIETPRSDKLSIVIWTGPAPEPWDPTTPNTKGLGGSETAAIEMAKHLAMLGHNVEIYGDPPAFQNPQSAPRPVYYTDPPDDGALYRHHSEFKGANCDVFISSRAPWAIDQFGLVNAKLKLLWVHDIHCGENNPQMVRWLLKFDRVLCLSEWHKGFFAQCYPELHPDQIVVTRNGIDPGRFQHATFDIAKRKNHMVWSSSPNRGLDMLLHNFQLIRAQVADAELHIYYGFDTWETMARMRNATDELKYIEDFKTLIRQAEQRGGVFWHGKRPQSEVAAAYMRAKVWGYLTGFTETSCITAMEAQAAGCVPVASRVAALGETVKHGVLLDNVDANTPNRFVDECVRLMTDDAYREPIARAGRQYALANLSWQTLAKQWTDLFSSLMTEIAVDPLPKFAEVK